MINQIRKYSRSEYLRNILVLSSGTGLAQAISILTAPILTRIYDPVYYDVLGLYMMITGLIGTVVTLQYHNVIVTSGSDEEADSALSLCISLSLIVAIVTLLLTILAFPFIGMWLHNSQIANWLFLAPLSVFFGGWNLAFSAYANRKKKFKLLSSNRIIAAVMVPAFSITIGILVIGPAGLIVGLLVSQVIPAIMLSRHFVQKGKFQLLWKIGAFRDLAKKYSAFPKFSLPAEFVNNFVNQVPVLMLATYFNVGGGIGNFNLSNRMLGMPVQLVSASILEVFRQKASYEFNQFGNCRNSFIKTLKLLSLTSFVPFLILMISGPWLFSFIFGHKWEMAGMFSQIMAPLFFLKFIVSPLSYMFYIAGKQREDLFGHIAMVAIVFLAFVITRFFTSNYVFALISYTVAYCLIYAYYLIRSYQFSKGK